MFKIENVVRNSQAISGVLDMRISDGTNATIRHLAFCQFSKVEFVDDFAQ